MNDWNSNIYDSVSEAHTASLLMLLCYIMWNRLVPGYLPACLGESKLETQFPGGDGCSGLFTKLVSQDLTSCSMPHLVSSKWEICVPTPILVWGRLPPSLCYWSLEPLCLECFSLAQSSLLAFFLYRFPSSWQIKLTLPRSHQECYVYWKDRTIVPILFDIL